MKIRGADAVLSEIPILGIGDIDFDAAQHITWIYEIGNNEYYNDMLDGLEYGDSTVFSSRRIAMN